MDQIKNLTRKLSFLSLPLCFLSFFFLDFSFRFFYRFTGTTALLSWKPLLFTFGWALLLTALISLLPRRGRRIAMLSLIAVFSLLAIVHGVLYRLVGKMFTFSDMNFAGDGARFFSWTYLNLRKAFFLCILFAVLLMALAAILAQKPREGAIYRKRLIAGLGTAIAAAAVIVSVHFSLMPKTENMWWGNTYDPNSESEVYKDFSDPNRCAMLTGLYQYTFRDLAISLGLGQNRGDIRELDAFYEQRGTEISGENEMTGALQGKNLIMVMLESIDTWLITPEYMPNLCAIQQESVDFTNFYTPVFLSAATFNTEIISQTGLIPAVSGLSASAYSTNAFPFSLANGFRELDYRVNSFHSASPAIYSRGTVHTNLGFEAYHNYVDMGMDNYQLDSQLINGYDLMTPEEPFYSFLITYSGHGPYTEEMQVISDPHYEKAKKAVEHSGETGSLENMEEYVNAVAHAMETDKFIGKLIGRLEEDDRLKDTALVFYTDHYGKYMSDRSFLLQVKGIADDGFSLYHTPCFLYGGGLSPKKVEKLCSSVDLAPTIANLYSLPVDLKYYMGDDIFGDRGGVVPLPNNAWYDGETCYSSNYQGEVTDEMSARSAEIKKRISASADTLKCDYFKSLSSD